jgi:hypothetical protein
MLLQQNGLSWQANSMHEDDEWVCVEAQIHSFFQLWQSPPPKADSL